MAPKEGKKERAASRADRNESTTSFNSASGDTDGSGPASAPPVKDEAVKIVMEGFLNKKKPDKMFASSWQTRYWILTSEVLEYRVKKGAPDIKGWIPLSAVSQVVIPDGKKQGRFDVVVGQGGDQRIFSLRCNNGDEADAWVSKIRGCVRAARENNHAMGKLILEEEGATGKGKKFWKDSQGLAKMRQGKLDAMLKQADAEKSAKKTADSTGFLLALTNRISPDTPLGATYLGQNRAFANTQYIVHAVKKELPRINELKLLFHEMRELYHPCLLKQAWYGESQDCIWAMYEPAFRPERSLLRVLRKHGHLPVETVKFFARQLVLVLAYLHLDVGYSFRNLSPELLYIQDNGLLMVSDTFLAVPAPEMPAQMGCPEYNTPEMHAKSASFPSEEDRMADWWRFGVFLYEMAVGMPPVRVEGGSKAKSEVWGKAISSFDSSKLQFPPWVSDDLQDLIRKLLVVRVDARLGSDDRDAESVQEHPWFGLSPASWATYLDTATPTPWLIDNVLNEFGPYDGQEYGKNESSQLTVIIPRARDYQINMESEEGTKLRQKDATEERLYCKVILGDAVQRTEECTTQEEEGPSWTNELTFPLANTGGVLQIQLVDCHRGFDSIVGDFTIPIKDIQKLPCHRLAGWCSLIESSQGLPNGEIEVDLRWQSVQGSAAVKTQHIARRLSSCFSEELVAEKRGPDQGLPDLPALPSVGVLSLDDESDDDEQEQELYVEEGPPPGSLADPTQEITRNVVLKRTIIESVRHCKDGFDLDLAYITPHVLAMAMPSNKSTLIGNPISDVQRFLTQAHKGVYKVYNLCQEEKYPAATFKGNGGVKELPLADQKAPPFHTLLEFCEDVDAYLKSSPQGVVAVHCKTGRGRTGTLVACYLLFAGICDTAEEALLFYAQKRLVYGIGVTCPSQKRYVQYFAQFMQQHNARGKEFQWSGKPLGLLRVRVTTVPNMAPPFGCTPFFRVTGPSPICEVLYDFQKENAQLTSYLDREAVHACINFVCEEEKAPIICGDVCFSFYHADGKGGKRMCSLWLNSSFVVGDYWCATKAHIDKASKDRKCEVFSDAFKIELYFNVI